MIAITVEDEIAMQGKNMSLEDLQKIDSRRLGAN
jgi:hypothetical protein